MTFTHTFDDRDENGLDLTVEVEVETGYALSPRLEYPAVESDIVIGNITDADGNQYDEEYFTTEEWQRILNAAETALEAV